MLRVFDKGWIREHLSAFICRETNWWISRWIQLHVFLCPKCRTDYTELKEVWKELDEWKIDEEPSTDCMESFHRNFQSTFPSAFENKEISTTSRVGDWTIRFAYATTVFILGLTVFLARNNTTSEGIQHYVQTKPIQTMTVKSDISTRTGNPPEKMPLLARSSQQNYQLIATSFGSTPVLQSRIIQNPLRTRKMVEVNNQALIGPDPYLALEDPRY